MPSSVTLSPAWALDGPLNDGESVRQGDVAALAFDAGSGGTVQVLSGVFQGGTRFGVSAGAGMTVVVNGGAAVVASGISSAEGGYRVAMMSPATLTVATADSANPRVDLVCITISDLGTSSSTTVVQVLTGTPAPGANLSNLTGAAVGPASTLNLAYVLVPATSTSVTSEDISDQRVFTVAPGGILPCASTSVVPAGGELGQYAYDQVNDRLFELSPSGPVQAKTLPWTPQATNKASVSWPGTGGGATLAYVVVTVDGNTDLELHGCWQSFENGSAGPNFSGEFSLVNITASGLVYRTVIPANPDATPGAAHGGGSIFHVTQSGEDRPAEGTYTVALNYFDTIAAGGNPTFITAPIIYVRAVPL